MVSSFMGCFIVTNVILIGIIVSGIINKLIKETGKINNRYILVGIKAIITGIVVAAYLYYVNIIAMNYELPGLLQIRKLFSFNMLIWFLISPIFTVLLFIIMYFIKR